MATIPDVCTTMLVSVTTIPRRFHQSLPKVIASIQQQSIRCKILINISDNYVKWPNETIVVPDAWIQDPDIHVYTTSRDFGPATKLLGAIEFLATTNTVVKGIDPNQVTHVVTIDDDIVYTDIHFLQRFLEASRQYPKYVLPVKSITLGYEPYHHLQGLIYDKEGFVDVPRGFHGVVYPLSELAVSRRTENLSGHFGPSLDDRFYMSPEFIATLPEEVFNDDDAFFGIILGLMNVPIFVVNQHLDAGSAEHAGESAVQEGVAKNRMQAEMEIFQFAVQSGFLPNKHRIVLRPPYALASHNTSMGMHMGWSNTFN